MAFLIKVARDSRPQRVAGSIAKALREQPQVHVQAIGADAVNVAVKATAIARQYLEADGLKLTLLPQFREVSIDGHDRTCIRLVAEVTEARSPAPAQPAGTSG